MGHVAVNFGAGARRERSADIHGDLALLPERMHLCDNNRWLRGPFTTGYHRSSLRLGAADTDFFQEQGA